ncbi:MAG: B12-binding domain-containing radical SAM protein [Desulfovibrionaceae bacterium]|nr:B12-binding domain-containing radical SAM protein [Desulfovibrionaceae bacterium]
MTPRVLFLYPTQYRVTGLPAGLGSLIASVRRDGVEARVFDTAFYPPPGEQNQNVIRARKGMSKAVANENILADNTGDMIEDLLAAVRGFKPQIAALSLLEPTFGTGVALAEAIKRSHPEIFIVAGGVFPTLSPELTIKEPSLDAICLGEGEEPLRLLVDNIVRRGDPGEVPGMWIKRAGGVVRSEPAPLHDLAALPHPDYTLFDPRLMLKPMQGRLYRMVNIVTSRGCPFQCTYCAAPRLRSFFKQSGSGVYFRNLSMQRVIEQLQHQIAVHDPEFIYFSSETFLAMDDADFDAFVAAYREIRLPFWIQTRFETVEKKRLQALKDVGLYWLTLGLEHGNPEFRREILRRNYSTRQAVEAAEILRDLNMGASLNNIIGFPGESREQIMETIAVNKTLHEIHPSLESNVFIFTPYRGTELFDRCRAMGLVDEDSHLEWSPAADDTALAYPQEWKAALRGLARTFNLYVKLPQSRYPEIALAESPTAEGQAMFAALQEELRGTAPA